MASSNDPVGVFNDRRQKMPPPAAPYPEEAKPEPYDWPSNIKGHRSPGEYEE